MTELDKAQIKADLVAHLRLGLEAEADSVAAEARAAAATTKDQYDIDTLSQQEEAGDLHALFQEVQDRKLAQIAEVEALDMGARSTVEPGAIVTVDSNSYIVGVIADEFQSGGRSFEGLSSQAPLYAVLEGKSAGDEVSFGGHTHRIDAVE